MMAHIMSSWTIILVLCLATITASISQSVQHGPQTCTNSSSICSNLNVTNLQDAKAQFLYLKHQRQAFVIRFHLKIWPPISTLELKSNSQNETFDPKTWLWTATHGSYVLGLPLDYHFVSLGLLGLREFDLDIGIADRNGCFANASGEERDFAIQKVLSEIVWQPGRRPYSIEQNTKSTSRKEYLCRSVYAYSSFLTYYHKKIGVGWKCISPESQLYDACSDGEIVQHLNKDHQRAMWVFVLILAFVLHLRFYTIRRIKIIWYVKNFKTWEWVGQYFGYSPPHYRTYILDIGKTVAKRWVHLSDDDLLKMDSKIGLMEIGQILGTNCHAGRTTIILKFLTIVAAFTLVTFMAIPLTYSERIIYLFSNGTETAFNLRSSPLAWWKTNPAFWTQILGMFIVIAINLALIIELVLVLVFVLGFHRGPPKDFSRYLSEAEKKGKKESKNPIMYVLLAVLFQIVDSILGLSILAGIFYPLVQAIAYVCFAVVVYIDVLTPWVVAIAMTLFHIYGNFEQFREPYVAIKEILQAEIMDREDSIQAYTVWNVFKDKNIRAFKSEAEEQPTVCNGSYKSSATKVVNRIQKLPPRLLSKLLVTFQLGKRPTVLLEHYFELCKLLIDNNKSLLNFCIRLFLFLTYSTVIMTSLTLYGSSSIDDRYSEGLVKGAVVFVFLLIPQIYYLQRARTKSLTLRMIWRLEIQRYLRTLETDWDGEFDTPEAKFRASYTSKRIKERWSVILDDDEINQDPPLEFPVRDDTSQRLDDYSTIDRKNHVNLNGISTQPAKYDTNEWVNSQQPTDVVEPEWPITKNEDTPEMAGSDPIIHKNRQKKLNRLSVSVGNVSNFSSTTT